MRGGSVDWEGPGVEILRSCALPMDIMKRKLR
jgi:hypothetical protein